MGFERAHEAFIAAHLSKRTGERKGRLERGHREAEKLFCKNVWWKLRGNFEGLHPEYEVRDWRGLSYFCDFVWIGPAVKLVIEIKGFGPHVRDMDRQKYCNELNRETFLTAMGYQVVCFAYDDVVARPELCVTLLRLLLSRYQAEANPHGLTTLIEREIIRLAALLARPLRPLDIENYLRINHRTAVRAMTALCARGLFSAERGPDGNRIVRYEPNESAWRHL
ncbi:DUF559 domain-containing protein [Cohnella sp. JJ-181]|uniref:DUF559 domain-containing protein n=1 Tax=Cohnella rhizoplanae TaxID=2974897 RepID=UPI0022FF5DEF|nr:DUF559 domain-containing protein [Cohnella sp. JJ-181]CAI6080539.1 hypothetical protein COHCIP112018_03018 [Cohnella sp. JJ-181]